MAKSEIELERLGLAMSRPLGIIRLEDVIAEPERPRIFDTTGAERDWAWAEQWWPADLILERAQPAENVPYLAKIIELRALDGPSTQLVTVRGLYGAPEPGVAVCRWWAGAPLGRAFPDDCHATRWQDQFVWGMSKEDGTIGFGMGTGDKPNSSGVWVAHCDAPGDWFGSGGWFGLTAHATWHVVYQITEVGEDPEPKPEPEGLVRVANIWLELESPEAE